MALRKTASKTSRKATPRRILRTSGKTGMFTRERLRQAVLNVEAKRSAK